MYIPKDLELKLQVSITDENGESLKNIVGSSSSSNTPRTTRLGRVFSSSASFENVEETTKPYHVAPVNNTLHSIIKGIDIIMGDVNLNPSSDRNYHLSSYIRNNTSFDEMVKGSWMQSSGWMTDDYHFMDDTTGQVIDFYIQFNMVSHFTLFRMLVGNTDIPGFSIQMVKSKQNQRFYLAGWITAYQTAMFQFLQA